MNKPKHHNKAGPASVRTRRRDEAPATGGGAPQDRNVAATQGGSLNKNVWQKVALSLRLSPREMEVLCGVFDDATEQAMALDRNMSPHTVHTHMRRLFSKLGVRTRAGLVRRAFQEVLNLSNGVRHGSNPNHRERRGFSREQVRMNPRNGAARIPPLNRRHDSDWVI